MTVETSNTPKKHQIATAGSIPHYIGRFPTCGIGARHIVHFLRATFLAGAPPLESATAAAALAAFEADGRFLLSFSLASAPASRVLPLESFESAFSYRLAFLTCGQRWSRAFQSYTWAVLKRKALM